VVDDFAGISDWEIEVSAGTSIEITTEFGDERDSARLVYEDDEGLRRATGFNDPISGRRLITGFVNAGDSLFVEFLFASGAPSGSLTMACISPGEHCGDLTDNDGDGAIDCADTHCARDPDCIDSQRDFDASALACTDEWELLEVGELDRISRQRTIYRLLDTDGDPVEEFWGGAETTIISLPRDRTVVIRSTNGGLACLGSDLGTHIFCDDAVRLGPDVTYFVLDIDLPVHLEPLGSAWTDLEVRVDCGTDD
jgi:hypothetical protein